MMYWYSPYYRRRRRTRPRNIDHGIKVRTKKGDIGKSWLSQIWIELVEDTYPDGDYTPGRTYARKGQVLDVKVERGRVTGLVQGAPVSPHPVSISVGVPNHDHAENVAKICRERPALAARILSGEMYVDMDYELREAGIMLFDFNWPIKIQCDCYGWGMCKHAAAVCYVLADEIDHDSFLYWKLLGVERGDILGGAKDDHTVPGEHSRVVGGIPDDYDVESSAAPDAVPPDFGRFWGSHDYNDSYDEMPMSLRQHCDPGEAGRLSHVAGF